jgi:hypothetical protein
MIARLVPPLAGYPQSGRNTEEGLVGLVSGIGVSPDEK